MATAVEDGLSRLSLTDSNEPHLSSLAVMPHLDSINLVLTVEKPHAITKTEFQAFAEETIHDLKIRLRKREFFTNKHSLVFGHRELLEDETVGQLACQSCDGNYLHIVAKLSDIEELEVVTNKQKRVVNNENRLPVSALSNYFKNDASASMNTCPLMLCGRVMDNGKELAEPEIESRHGDPIVHLIIRKSSTVHWHLLKGERFELRISADATVDEVKRKIGEVADGFEANEHAIVKAGHTLQPGMSLSELGIQKGDVLEMVRSPPLRLEEFPEPSSPKMSPKSEMPFEWEKAKDALAQGVWPKLTSVGTGGSYFISALEGMNLAVFKPEDEEPLAPNNPKGHRGSPTGDGLRKGVRPGEGATREVIAFALDHDRFSGVPPTTMASLKDYHSSSALHRKVGSFQQFVQHDVDCEEMGSSNFPVHEVHKIAVLDIRLANTDRNAGNILASRKEGQWVLTPIDHGYCLPDSFEDINFEWMYWPQANIPFDDATRQYISKLDAKQDLDMLFKAGLSLRPACVRVFRVCTMLLKKATSHGLTPYQIARIMCRQSFNMSPLEKLHKGAKKLTLGKMYGGITGDHLELDEDLYLQTMSTIIDQYLEETHEFDVLVSKTYAATL